MLKSRKMKPKFILIIALITIALSSVLILKKITKILDYPNVKNEITKIEMGILPIVQIKVYG